MSSRFIGNGNGLVLRCNHGDVSFGQRPAVDNGSPVLNKDGTPAYEHVFPPKCENIIRTGQILRSGIRAYAKTQGWSSAEVGGRIRDFCHEHAKSRAEHAKNAKDEAKRLKDERAAAREKAKQERRDAWLAKQREWKQRREEKAAAKAARAARKAA